MVAGLSSKFYFLPLRSRQHFSIINLFLLSPFTIISMTLFFAQFINFVIYMNNKYIKAVKICTSIKV